jgi:hypothetical protein
LFRLCVVRRGDHLAVGDSGRRASTTADAGAKLAEVAMPGQEISEPPGGTPVCGRLLPSRKIDKPCADPYRPFQYQSAEPTRLEIPMALSGPAHYAKADELLAEIEATPALSNETETSLATRAVAHAVLAAAAAIALNSSGPDSRAWQETARTT